MPPQGSFNRPNIGYEVRHKELLGDGSRDAVLADLVEFLKVSQNALRTMKNNK